MYSYLKWNKISADFYSPCISVRKLFDIFLQRLVFKNIKYIIITDRFFLKN